MLFFAATNAQKNAMAARKQWKLLPNHVSKNEPNIK